MLQATDPPPTTWDLQELQSPAAPWGSTPWQRAAQGALPAQVTITATWSGSKGHPGGSREFRRNGRGGISQLVQGPEVSWILPDKLGWV